MGKEFLHEIPRPIPGWTPSTPAVDPRSFDELPAEHAVVAVHFWASWDGYDRLLDEKIQKIRADFAGRIHFVSCDTDLPEYLPLLKRCSVLNVPMVAVFVCGQQRRPICGVPSSEQLANEIDGRLSEEWPKRPRWKFWG